jgi:hypothetical protein
METIRYIYEIVDHRGYYYIGQRKLPKYCNTVYEDNYMGSGKHLKNAFKSYGLEKFKKRILISGPFSQEITNYLEKYFIEYYRVNLNSYYNIASGGLNAFNGIKKGSKMSEEYCLKRRHSHKRRMDPKLVSKNCSEAAYKKFENPSNHLALKEGWKKFLLSDKSKKWRESKRKRASETLSKRYSNIEERIKQSKKLKELFEKEPERRAYMSKKIKEYLLTEEGKNQLKKTHKIIKEKNYLNRIKEFPELYFFDIKSKKYEFYTDINVLLKNMNRGFSNIKRTILRCIKKYEQNQYERGLDYIILPFDFKNSDFLKKYE